MPTNFRSRTTEKKLKFARKMRKHPTPTEALLWDHLRERQLGGFRFRRQCVILGWIADFYCPELGLVVEVDGKQHGWPVNQELDRKRDQVLLSHGFKTIRFESWKVRSEIDAVLQAILDAAGSRHPRRIASLGQLDGPQSKPASAEQAVGASQVTPRYVNGG